MITDDQIRDEKLQYDIKREAAKISALSSAKIDKYKYLTGEEILPFNKQQIIEHAKFTYFPLGKAFEKQIKTIEDQGEKQIKALKDLKDLKPKEQRKTIEGESNNQSKAVKIFNDLIKERKSIMNELYVSVDMNKLYFKYVCNTKDVNFYEYIDSKELFNKIKNNQIKFDDALKKQKLFLNRLNDVKIGKKTPGQKKVITNLENFYKSREKVFNFLEAIPKWCLILTTKQNKMKLKEPDLKYYCLNKCFKPKVKARNSSENLLNEIRQIVYPLFQSKEITKTVYNNIIKSIQ